MWEKMLDYRHGVIMECNGRTLHEMVKSAVRCVKAIPVKIQPAETKKRQIMKRLDTKGKRGQGPGNKIDIESRSIKHFLSVLILL
jgi:hypothetical protein